MEHIKQYATKYSAAVLFPESTDDQELDRVCSLVCLYMTVIIASTLLFLENYRSSKELTKNWVENMKNKIQLT